MKILFTAFQYILLFSFCITISCGKKGDPTLKSYEKPLPPEQMRAVHREGDIILWWNYPEDNEISLEGFVLSRLIRGQAGEVIQIAKNQRSYADRDIVPDNVYIYTMVAKNLKGMLSKEAQISVSPGEVPPPIRNIRSDIGIDSLELSWESAGENILYNIYKRSETGTYGLVPLNSEPLTVHSFTDRLEPNKTVFYIIRSLRGGPLRDEGPPSEEIAITPSDFIPATPRDLQAVQVQGLIRLIWKESPEQWVYGYRIYRKTDKDKEYKLIGETATPTFLDPDAAAISRSYRVAPVGPSDEGVPAEMKNILLKTNR